jgi:hypothetical protein
MKYNKIEIVYQCFHGCSFFGGGHEMSCDHPYFKDKGAYENMIITQDNSHGRVPDECPLKNEPAEIMTIVKLKK